MIADQLYTCYLKIQVGFFKGAVATGTSARANENKLENHGQKFRTTQRRTRGTTQQYGRQTIKGF